MAYKKSILNLTQLNYRFYENNIEKINEERDNTCVCILNP